LDVVYIAIPKMDKPIQALDGKAELLAKDYWSKLPERIDGKEDDKRPGEYHSAEFGTLYKQSVGKILHDNFGVESQHNKNGSLLTFDRYKIQRLKSQLNSKIKVTAVTAVTADKEGGITLSTNNNCENEEIDSGEIRAPPSQLLSLPSLPSPSPCPTCGEPLDSDPYYAKFHICTSTD
jgi:hypothetical protein